LKSFDLVLTNGWENARRKAACDNAVGTIVARDCAALTDEEHARISLAYIDGKIGVVK